MVKRTTAAEATAVLSVVCRVVSRRVDCRTHPRSESHRCAGVGQKRHESRALDRLRDLRLLLSGEARALA